MTRFPRPARPGRLTAGGGAPPASPRAPGILRDEESAAPAMGQSRRVGRSPAPGGRAPRSLLRTSAGGCMRQGPYRLGPPGRPDSCQGSYRLRISSSGSLPDCDPRLPLASSPRSWRSVRVGASRTRGVTRQSGGGPACCLDPAAGPIEGTQARRPGRPAPGHAGRWAQLVAFPGSVIQTRETAAPGPGGPGLPGPCCLPCRSWPPAAADPGRLAGLRPRGYERGTISRPARVQITRGPHGYRSPHHRASRRAASRLAACRGDDRPRPAPRVRACSAQEVEEWQ